MLLLSIWRDLQQQGFARYLIARFDGAIGEADGLIACVVENIDLESDRSDETIVLAQVMVFSQ